jgi:transglutaminase-like putative cysteine protease
VATQRQTTAPRIALAALSAAAAIGLVRVFADAAWLVPAVIAALLPHALFAFADNRRWPSLPTLSGVVAFGALFTMVAVEPSTTFNGIPTTATFRAFGDDLGLASHVLRTAVVPVAPTGAALALALMAIWLVATTADWLAWRLDATLGALGPSLVLFVAVAALGEGAHWPTTILYGGAAAAFLLTEHYSELLERRTWFHLPRRRQSRVLSGGALAGVVAVVLALGVGPLLPGARGEAWFDYRGLGDHKGSSTWTTITPLVNIRTRLVSTSDQELFTVKANHAQYWRLVALDRFNGEVWGLESEAPRVGSQLPTTGPSSPRSMQLTQQFSLGVLGTRWLPAAYRAVDVDRVDDLLFIRESVSLVNSTDTSPGMKYSVTSMVPTPTQDELQTAKMVDPAEWRSDLALPDNFPENVRKLAHRVMDRQPTPYDKARALQNFFRDPDNFTYDTNVDPGHSDSAIEEFLFRTRRGYCEQFAGTYAAMARAVGLPARVAVGFTPGTPDASGVYHVTNRQAHAWPEVWLDGVGWLPFEPTPGRSEPTAGDPTGTGGAPTTTVPTTPSTTATSTPTSAGGPASTITPPKLDHIDVGGGGVTAKHDGNTGARVLVGIAVAAGLVLLVALAIVLGVLLVKSNRRRQRRHAADLRDRVTGAWAEALDRLREAGVSPRVSATPVEFAMRHAAAHGAGLAGPPLMDLARLQTEALFAADAPSPEQVDDAWRRVHDIQAALKKTTRWSRRWRRRLDPRSLRVSPAAG